MLKLRVVQARYGDCLILENGSGSRWKYVLVDGGPPRVYRPHLRPELERIAAAGGRLELAVLTHVDNDHVMGLLEMFRELESQQAAGQPPLIAIRGLWHNGFSRFMPRALQPQADALEAELLLQAPSPDGGNQAPEGNLSAGVSFGIAEGHALMQVETGLAIARNASFPDQLITLENARGPLKVGGMKLWIIGPPAANLERLRERWVQWLMRESLPFGPGQAPVKPDDSEANLSSIMFLAEAGRRRILLTGDGLGDDILDGLEKVGLLPPGGVMQVDIFKVPHHGSARNVVGALFDRVQARTYVLCADGRHGNPDDQTLTWLVDSACRQSRPIRIFATTRTPSIERLLRDRPPESNFYRLDVLPEGQSSALL
jgi:hypothetical protein